MPQQRQRKRKSFRPKGRRPRRQGPAPKLVRVQLRPGGDKFPVNAYQIDGVDQGNRCYLDLNKILPDIQSGAQPVPQDLLRADARLVGLKVIIAPVGNANPSGMDILVRGPPNMPKLGAVVGRSREYFDRNKSSHVNCRLPRAVTEFYIEDPYTSTMQIVLQQRLGVMGSGEVPPDEFPPIILELRFAEQPIETIVL